MPDMGIFCKQVTFLHAQVLLTLIFCQAGRPGSTTCLAIKSASTTGTPNSRKIVEAELLPVPIPPVKPTRNIFGQKQTLEFGKCGGYSPQIADQIKMQLNVVDVYVGFIILIGLIALVSLILHFNLM